MGINPGALPSTWKPRILFRGHNYEAVNSEEHTIFTSAVS
jgi:hypothetical protein